MTNETPKNLNEVLALQPHKFTPISGEEMRNRLTAYCKIRQGSYSSFVIQRILTDKLNGIIK